jgi:Fe-S oxidoreductase
MECSGEKGFGCGAGGARCPRRRRSASVNQNRADEAIGTGAAKVAVACPFCSVMLNDGVTARQAKGDAEGVAVVDLATVLLDSVKSRDGATAGRVG